MNSELLSNVPPNGSAPDAVHEHDASPQKCRAMLHASSLAAEQLLSRDWRGCMNEILEAIGEATQVSRSYLFELVEQNGKWFASMRNEWAALDIAAEIETPEMQRLDFEVAGIARWAEILAGAGVVRGQIGDFPFGEQRILDEQSIVSIALVPIHVEGVWWGVLGFDECNAKRVWDESDIEVLRLLADMIGAAVTRGRADQALRASEAELRALFASMQDVILVIDGSGTYRKVIANAPELLYKPSSQLEGRTLEEVIGGDVAREFLGIVRDVLDTKSVRRFEYALPIDGQNAWFSASVTPLSPDTVLWVARDMTPAHQAREALRESEALFRLLAENSTDKIARLSDTGKFLYVSPSVQVLLGYAPEELIGIVPFEMIHPADRHIVVQSFELIMNTPGLTDLISYRMRRRDGIYVWFETTSRVQAANGKNREIHTVSRDISSRRAAEDALREAEAKYRSIFENAVEGIFQTTPDGTYLDANPSLSRIYGYDSPARLKAGFTDISSQLYLDARRRQDFIDEMKEKGSISNFEAQIKRKDGQIIWISENARAVRDENDELLYYEGTVEDITARKNAEEQLLHDALHDKLTGLSNRALFMDRLTQSFGRLRRHPEAIFAVLFLDFDRFKNINDSLGHMAGDQLLIAVSHRIAGCLRPGDTVSRLGGDEFSVLLEDIGDVAGAIMVAERIQSAMQQPFAIASQQVFTSASIGIALSHLEYEHPEDLLRDADMAMYRAKATGKARHEVFDAGMHKRAVALLQLETDLRWAIERAEFQLYYQPIVDLGSGRVGGFEALIRWQHPTRGLVSPLDFIPIAEETGWIVPIGRWVLNEACRQLAEWQREIPRETPLSISVNLSGKQFSQPDLITGVEEVLTRYELPPGCLKLEITESALMENVQDVTDRLLQLHGLGVKLGLDDFGTGYSSLSYLHRFSLDTLKIDRSFIARMSEGGENREIVRTIVSLGKNLGMDVVAEGVEDATQLADLRALKCKSGQGYFFARPLTAVDARQMLENAPVW